MNIENAEAIDVEVKSLNVNGDETPLVNLLQVALSADRIPIIFTTRSIGQFNISNLVVKFKEQ